MSDIQTDYDLLQDKITEMLQQHADRNAALSLIYQRAITEDVLAMIDAGLVNADDIEGALIDLERKLGVVTDNVAYQVLKRSRDLITVQQYFWSKYGYPLDLAKEYERLRAIQANVFEAFSGIPPSIGTQIRDMLRDNEIMGRGKSAVNEEIQRIAQVTESRAKLISGTSEFLYIGKFNANKAEELGVEKFQYKPGFAIPSSRDFSRWAVEKKIFTKDELDSIDAGKWDEVEGLTKNVVIKRLSHGKGERKIYYNGWQGKIPNVPVLVQGGGYNTIHRFALFFDGVSRLRPVTQPLQPAK